MTTVAEAKEQEQDERHIFSFGVIADVQYADADDGVNFEKTKTRRFRNGLKILQSAAEWWKAQSTPLECIVQLGDLIDGRCKSNQMSDRCLEEALEAIRLSGIPRVLHLIGNHELYNFTRDELSKRLNTTPNNGPSWYYTIPTPGWRLIVTDPYQISTLNGEYAPSTEQAYEFLKKHNPNDVRLATDWTVGLEGENLRYLPYNGAIGPDQLAWLDATIKDAADKGDRCFVLSHVPLIPNCSVKKTVLWNYKEIVKVLHQNTSVVACLYGHDHDGGFHTDTMGVHHITFPSPLECKVGEACFGTMDVFHDRLELRGQGKVQSRRLEYRCKSKV